MNLVLISKYCELTGESRNAVAARIKAGKWIQGMHFYYVEGMRERWVDIEAVRKWVKNGGTFKS